MCFSAEASFAVGTALLPVGAFCVVQAVRKKPDAIPLAVVPIVFGVQQISEGFVWRALHVDDPAAIRDASLAFLFFAVAFWPFWFPLITTIIEPQPGKRKWFFALAILSTFWLGAMYLPLVFGPPSLLTTSVKHHSIQYQYPDLWLYDYIPKKILRVVYFLMVALPMGLSSESLGKVPGIMLGLSAIVAAVIYDYAFVSVWCFFAAIMSGYMAWMFWKMPNSRSLDS